MKAKVEAKKELAAKSFKNGAYSESIDLYKAAATTLEITHEDFPVFKKEISQMEAAIYNNIAFCYGKDKHDKQ